MKILIISQYYPPENATLASTIAEGLAENGHTVRVLTGFPNYPDGVIFKGYEQKWRQRETINGIDVLRVPLYPDHSMNPVARAANYASFALSSATARAFAEDVDVIYVYATQMTPAFGPWLWRKLRGAPYVLHVQDLWPDSVIGSSLVSGSRTSRFIEAALSPWLKSVYRSAASIIGIAPTMVNTLIERGSPKERTHLIYNWADEFDKETTTVPQVVERQGTNIVFAGNVGDMQDLETVVRAAHLVQDTSIRVTIIGDGVALDRIKDLAAEIGAENVDFQGRVPLEKMPEIWAEADFSLVTLRDLPLFRGTIPSKFQAALSNEVPVITNVQGDLRGLVEDLHIGFTAEVEDPTSLAECFVRASELDATAYRQLKERTSSVYADHFSCAAAISAIETELVNAAGAQKPKTHQPESLVK